MNNNHTNAIETFSLTKVYGEGNLRLEVLKSVNMSIANGEYVAIMGKSGAGKSTLLYQISLLDLPTSGEIALLGQNTTDYTEADRTSFRLENLGYIFQDYALVPELTAEENVRMPLIMLGWDENKSITAAREALSRVGLEDKFNNRPSQLSGGQQQRVSIARAVAKDPKILFADEPTANLDGASSEEVLQVLKQLHQHGQTIVMITHEQDYTRDCDRVLWMQDGLFIAQDDS